LKTI
jgi:dynamin 1-like protein